MSVSIRDGSFGQPLIFIELAVRHSFCVERCWVGSRASSSGIAIGNVMASHMRARDGATFTETSDLMDLAASDFADFYIDPLNADLRQRGDLSRLIGQGPAASAIVNDYCARPRPSALTLGAVEHSLGDCDTTHTWPEDSRGGADGGFDGGSTQDGGTPDGGSGKDGGKPNLGDGGTGPRSYDSGDAFVTATHACGVTSSGGSGAWVAIMALLVVSRLVFSRRR